jgi:hypothetical protein
MFIEAQKPVIASEGPILVTVPNVPLVATGIEYQLASGPATFTADDLLDAVASQNDPAIQPPRLKVGHVDPRFNGPEYDGDPAFGKFVNLRVSADGQVLIADAVGVPKWFADIMPVAYPGRSIEGGQNATTVTGHKWGLVIDAVALLGVKMPGVSVLEDLPLLYGETIPDGVVIVNPETGKEVEAMTIAAATGEPVTAAVAVEDIRRAFYDQLEADQMWWWIRSMHVDPNELIVDDDDGNLYRVSYTPSEAEGATFGEPKKVKIKYVDAAKRMAGRVVGKEKIGMAVVTAGRELSSWETRAASRPADNKEEGVDMKIDIPALRSRLQLTEEQLPDDATEEQVNAALSTEAPEKETEKTETTTTETEKTETETEPASTPEPEAVAASSVTVPKSEWERTQAELQRVTAKVDEDDKTARAGIVENAIKAGKIRPADKQSYLNGIETPATREQYTTLLTAAVDKGGLAPNIVPVTERGVNPGDEVTAGGEHEYDQSWLSPQERQRIAAAKDGTLSHGAVQDERKDAQMGAVS